MKRLNLLFLVLIVFPLSSVAQTVITYDYDAAGNRTIRTSSVEIAAIVESQAITESKILELDFGQELLYCRDEFCHVINSANDDSSDDMLLENTRTENNLLFTLYFVEFPVDIIQTVIITKHKI